MEQTVRYRYRVYPTTMQEQALRRLFGCCRVVWNDTVHMFRDRFDPTDRGSVPKPGEAQRIILTDAKRTPEREWLGDVSNVALSQIHRDAMQACWNGVRRNRRQRFARYRSLKRNPVNSARFTVDGFRIRGNGKVYLAKIGDLKVRWSRPLPSIPKSCTIIREPDGAWYVSFVVTRETTPLPETETNAAIDLGFTYLGELVDTDGKRHRIPAPKPLNRLQRRLARLQRKESRQRQGSRRREDTRDRINRLYAKARHQLDDRQNKEALQIIRETQTVGLETLSVRGMGKRHGRSVLTVAPARFVGKLKAKAEQYGRAIIQIGRWEPTTRLCSQCKHHVAGGIPEQVRVWECAQCHTILDRDYNAALNILDAAGLAESLNAHGDHIRLRLATAGRSNGRRSANPSDGQFMSGPGIPVL
ncbi:RNA-guided endonuclease InsQ/TnpB family protein [Bifidobacterium myosotis]|uniref:RNA-guided endonuclease InsQ/TnpB family protein n=1 Tax=Bifidobacterium myosotis TaxID=1630166 RepID=UPI00168BF177|nr:RNA-guided endonuclease TnpB family protein [Bifidobacterium myosotis]